MRILWLTLAAVFSLAAVAVRYFDAPGWIAVVAILIAAVFLVLGFREQAGRRETQPIVLSAEQEETVRRMIAEGNHSGAIRQVQMWFRGASAEDAQAVVEKL